MINTRESTRPDAIIVEFTEDHLDAGNVSAFKDAIDAVLSKHQMIMVDLNKVNFIDSSGLGSLLSCLRAMNNKGGHLKLFGLSQPVRALFELVRMHRVFEIYNGEAEANASV